MFNEAYLYNAKYADAMTKDFKEKFPGMADEMEVKFANDPAGKHTWADSVLVRGTAYYCMFSAHLSKQYGNCGLSIVSGFDVDYKLYKKGIGTWFMKWVINMLVDMGYTIAIGTTNPHQTVMWSILKKTGWEEIDICGFNNRRTNNQIKFWRINLPEKAANVIAPAPQVIYA